MIVQSLGQGIPPNYFHRATNKAGVGSFILVGPRFKPIMNNEADNEGVLEQCCLAKVKMSVYKVREVFVHLIRRPLFSSVSAAKMCVCLKTIVKKRGK